MSCLHRACNLENITPQRRLGNAFGFLAFVPVSVVAVIIAVVSPMAMSMTMPVAVTMSAGVFVLEVDFVERLSVGMVVVYYDKGWKCAASAMDMAFLYPKEPMYVQLSLNARVVNASRTATIPGLLIRDHASIAPNAASLVRRKSRTEIQSANWWKGTLRSIRIKGVRDPWESVHTLDSPQHICSPILTTCRAIHCTRHISKAPLLPSWTGRHTKIHSHSQVYAHIHAHINAHTHTCRCGGSSTSNAHTHRLHTHRESGRRTECISISRSSSTTAIAAP